MHLGSLLALENGNSIWKIVSILPRGRDGNPARMVIEPYSAGQSLLDLLPADDALGYLPGGPLRSEAERAYSSLEKAIRAGRDWSLVGLASRRVLEKVIYAVLVAWGIDDRTLDRENLVSLIEHAEEVGILDTDRVNHAAHMIRLLGNADHPGRASREGRPIEKGDALAAVNALSGILKSFRRALTKKGH